MSAFSSSFHSHPLPPLTPTTLITFIQHNPNFPSIKIHLGSTPLDFQPSSSNISTSATPVPFPHFTLLTHVPSLNKIGEYVAWANITNVKVEYWITCTFSSSAGYHDRLDKGLVFKEKMMIFPVTLQTTYAEACDFVNGCFSLSQILSFTARQGNRKDPVMTCALDCDNVTCSCFYMCGNQGCKYIICMECFNLYARSKMSHFESEEEDDSASRNLVGLTTCPFCSSGYFCVDEDVGGTVLGGVKDYTNTDAVIEDGYADHDDVGESSYAHSYTSTSDITAPQSPPESLYEQMKAMQLSQSDAYSANSPYGESDPNEILGFKITDFTTVGKKKKKNEEENYEWKPVGKSAVAAAKNVASGASGDAWVTKGKAKAPSTAFTTKETSSSADLGDYWASSTPESRALFSVGCDPTLAKLFMARYDCRANYDLQGAETYRLEIAKFGYVCIDRDYLVQEYAKKGVKCGTVKFWSPPVDRINAKTEQRDHTYKKQLRAKAAAAAAGVEWVEVVESSAETEDNGETTTKAALNKQKKKKAQTQANKAKKEKAAAENGETRYTNEFDWLCEFCGFDRNFQRNEYCYKCNERHYG